MVLPQTPNVLSLWGHMTGTENIQADPFIPPTHLSELFCCSTALAAGYTAVSETTAITAVAELTF